MSIGLQTTDNELLKTIGRIHNFEQFVQNYNLAREVGFENINVDLILALPGGSVGQVKKDLDRVLELKPEHISTYSLIVEEGTPLSKMDLEFPSEDEERKIYWTVKNVLEQNGYVHYEISNFAKPR